MGLKSFLFGSRSGGFGADQPNFRNATEYSGMLDRIGLMARENPGALLQMFGTKEGKNDLKALGFNSLDDLINYAQTSGPNVAGSGAYSQLAGEYGVGLNDIMSRMSGMSGDLTDYGADFQLDDISNIPDEVYQQMQEAQNEQAARGFKGALRSLSQQYGAQGFRPGSGFERSRGTGLGRSYLEQLKDISRNVQGQKAQSQLDVAKFMSNQKLARQNQRENYLTQLQQYAKNFGMQNLQNQAAIANQRMQGLDQLYGGQTEAAMLPYNTNMQYYYNTMGQNQAPQKNGGAFGKILKTGAQIASAAAPMFL